MEKEAIMLNVEVTKEQLAEIRNAEYLRFDDKIFLSKDRAVALFRKWAGMDDTNEPIGNCNKPHVNGWHLFSEQRPTEGDNIEVYYDDITIVNIDWQDYLYNDKEFKHMRFWRACR